MAKPILLSVDDDSDVLRAIERDLRSQYGAEYRVLASDSPQGALDLLKRLKVRNDSVALLLADQRMPTMDDMGLLPTIRKPRAWWRPLARTPPASWSCSSRMGRSFWRARRPRAHKKSGCDHGHNPAFMIWRS